MNIDAKVDNEIFRKDHPMILAANRHLTSIKSARLAYDSGGYVAGQVLGKNSVSSEFADYADAGASGLDTAVGILLEDVPVEAFPSTTGSAMARMVVGGEVFEAKCTTLTSSAKTDLNGRSIVDSSGVTIFKF